MTSQITIQVQKGQENYTEHISIPKDCAKVSELRQMVRLQLDRRKVLSIQESSSFELFSDGQECLRDTMMSLIPSVANRNVEFQFILSSKSNQTPSSVPLPRVPPKWKQEKTNSLLDIHTPILPPPRNPMKKLQSMGSLPTPFTQVGSVDGITNDDQRSDRVRNYATVPPPRNPRKKLQSMGSIPTPFAQVGSVDEITNGDQTLSDEGTSKYATIGPSAHPKPQPPPKRSPHRAIGYKNAVAGRGIASQFGAVRSPEGVEDPDGMKESGSMKQRSNQMKALDAMKKWESSPNMMGSLADSTTKTFSTITKPIKDLAIRARNKAGHTLAQARKSAQEQRDLRMSLPLTDNHQPNRPRRTTDPPAVEHSNRPPTRSIPPVPPPWRRTGEIRDILDAKFEEVVEDIVPPPLRNQPPPRLKKRDNTGQRLRPSNLSVSEEDRMRRALSVEINQATMKQEAEILHDIISHREKQLSADFWKTEGKADAALNTLKKQLEMSNRETKLTSSRLSMKIKDVEELLSEEERRELQLAVCAEETGLNTANEFDSLLSNLSFTKNK